MQDEQATQRHKCLFMIIISLKHKRSVLSAILRLQKGEKGTNLSTEYGMKTQQISDICCECRRLLHNTRLEVFATDNEDVNHIFSKTIYKCSVSRVNVPLLI